MLVTHLREVLQKQVRRSRPSLLIPRLSSSQLPRPAISGHPIATHLLSLMPLPLVHTLQYRRHPMHLPSFRRLEQTSFSPIPARPHLYRPHTKTWRLIVRATIPHSHLMLLHPLDLTRVGFHSMEGHYLARDNRRQTTGSLIHHLPLPMHHHLPCGQLPLPAADRRLLAKNLQSHHFPVLQLSPLFERRY